jgi:hypothetical protein
MVDKKVKGTLVGVNSNAFVLLGTFKKMAKAQGWTNEEIDEVYKEATKKDYNHLLVTLLDHMEED